MSKGWLINDRLTCIPNTKTFWHFLLEKFPFLEDKTSGYTDFNYLPIKIENELYYCDKEERPDYIIRNATYFRKLNTNIPTISFLQDPYYQIDEYMFNRQIEVCNASQHVVYNSQYTKLMYEKFINKPSSVINIGTDKELFFPKKKNINNNTIGFIGSSDENFKGFSMVQNIIKNTNYKFRLVMKDSFSMNTERVKTYNNITQEELSLLMSDISLLLCTSKKETLHLAGIEAMFCDVPVVANNVGIYMDLKNDNRWGKVISNYSLDQYLQAIDEVLLLKKQNKLSPRQCMIDNKMSLNDSYNNWKNIIDNL